MACIQWHVDPERQSYEDLVARSAFVGVVEIESRERVYTDGDQCGFAYTASVKESLKGDHHRVSFFGSTRSPEIAQGQRYFAVLFDVPDPEGHHAERVRRAFGCMRQAGDFYFRAEPLTLLPFDVDGRQIVSSGGQTVLSISEIERVHRRTTDGIEEELFAWSLVKEHLPIPSAQQ